MAAAGKKLDVDERAMTVIASMNVKVQTLAASWGTDHEHYVKAVESMARALHTLFVSGFSAQSNVYRDDALSLVVHEGGFTYGIVWHEYQRRCAEPGCNAYIRPDGQAYHYGARDTWTGCADGEHVPDIPLTMSTPGTWSQHS